VGPIFRSFAEAPRSRPDGYGFDRFLFFGQADALVEGPQAYMNELDPDVELAAHFHQVDQFQVFFGTPGARFLRHSIAPAMVHYTDAYTTYGPFRSGPDDRLLYATLRAEHSNYGGVMPGARKELRYRGTRNISRDLENWTVDVAPVDGAVHREVLRGEEDGLACVLTLAAAGTEFSVERSRPSAGRYYCVLDGAVLSGGTAYPGLTLGWVDGSEEASTLVAGPEGCSLLTLDFPSPPTRVQRAADAG
jgi:hypothetical protein